MPLTSLSVEFACFPHIWVGFLQLLWIPHTNQKLCKQVNWELEKVTCSSDSDDEENSLNLHLENI